MTAGLARIIGEFFSKDPVYNLERVPPDRRSTPFPPGVEGEDAKDER